MAFSINTYSELTDLEIVQDPSLGVMKWGRNNAFPQTLQNLHKKSPSAKQAVDRTRKFYKGERFVGDDIIVHPSGIKLCDIISFIANDFALFGGFAIHVNYNLNYDITDFRPISLTDLRFNELDELSYASKICYHSNFGRNSPIDKTIPQIANKGNIKQFYRFNPDPNIVAKQIADAGGIENYNGQILYYSNDGVSMYPTSPLLAAMNYVLSDVENGVLVRKETATGFINSYLLKTTLDSEDPTLINFEDALQQAQGARGNGKVITFSGLAPEDVASTLLESIDNGTGSTGIIDSAKKTHDLDRDVIFGSYMIPPILGGVQNNNAFTSDELKDAYFVFNATTKEGRQVLSTELNSIVKRSVFAQTLGTIKIPKVMLDAEPVSQQSQQQKGGIENYV